jgi:hypothetical protein
MELNVHKILRIVKLRNAFLLKNETKERFMPGENLDISSTPLPQSTHKGGKRHFVGIHFACCDVYSRIYVNPARTAYEGHCPKCCRPVRIRIGPGGTTSRFFTAR